MIKEKKKITKYNYTKNKTQIILEYIRTIGISLVFAIFVTSSLAFHARNEMIKDIYMHAEEQEKLDKQVALQLITQTNLLKDLKNKKYAVCYHVGELYETAGDYKDAQIAYELALQKAKPGNFKPYYKLICTLVAQEKFNDANSILNKVKDFNNKNLIKFKTRSYLTIGDKYYSIGKFLSAAKTYEKAFFYYNKFSKKDSIIENSIKNRIINSYIQVGDIMVKYGKNSDAIRFLKKAETYSPNDFQIRYKLAIILADLDPEKSINYFEKLISERPQDIDYGTYNNALMKAANIADLDNRHTKAKYYRYKTHSIDMFLKRKVIYRNDIEVSLKKFIVKKVLFTYPLKATYNFTNISNNDIVNLQGDFILTINDKAVETITTAIADKSNPLLSNNITPNEVNIKFKRKIYTKKELENYKIKIYLYKDDKFKTLVGENKIPLKRDHALDFLE